jgi:hypothetical protein
MKHRKSSEKNRKNIQKKPAFANFAEKLIENLKILNEINECPHCKSTIENNEKICPKCGTELKIKSIEENLEYIRAYLQDVNYTMHERIGQHVRENIRLKEEIKDLKLKMGYETCSKCSGEGSSVITIEHSWDMFAFNPRKITSQNCKYCNGEGIIKKKKF